VILFISDINKKISKTIKNYFVISILCVLIVLIYYKFSHGVTSQYMTFIFLYPLIGGTFVFFIIENILKKKVKRLAFNFYNSGVATLVVGSLISGIFEIAGTSSKYQSIFYILGYTFIILSVLKFLLDTKKCV
jgi:uncharacterized membrane protein YdcZ (DUF606 family)